MSGRKFLMAGVVAVMVLLGAVSAVGAWPDLPPSKAIVSGPGIEGQVEITDVAVLDVLRLGGLEDMGWGVIAKQEGLEGGFKIVRYFEGGEFHYGDLVYYPNATAARSVVYFEDGLNGNEGPSPLNKKWLYATENGDRVLQGYLKSIGAHLADAKTLPGQTNSANADAVPETVVVGEAVTLGFTLPQDLKIAPVSLHREGETHRIVIAANAAGAAGHYEFTYTFQQAGVWDWAVRATYNDVEIPMPALTVVEGGDVKIAAVGSGASKSVVESGAAESGAIAPMTVGLAVVAGIIGLAGIVGVFTMRRKSNG